MLAILLMGIFMSLPEPTNVAPLPFAVPLNHFYLVLDSATFKEIQGSPFLRSELAPSEERTTVRADTTYTGLYFYGRNTYFEFFDAGHEKGRKIGDSAIAFGVEQSGAAELLRKRAAEDFPLAILPITRQLEGRQLPWFFMLTPKSKSLASGIDTWTMEYDARFLAGWHAEIEEGGRGISRREILQRYVAILKGVPAAPLLQDVLSITLAADPAATAMLRKQGDLFGYRRRRDDVATVLEGYGFTLRLVPETASRHGIQQVTLRLGRQPGKQKEYRFGARSVLTFHADNTATWSF